MRRALIGMAVGALVLTGCGGGSTDQAKPAPVLTMQTPNATPALPPSAAASKAAADHAAAVARQQAKIKAAHAKAVAHQRALRHAQAVEAAKVSAHAKAVKAAHRKAVRNAQAVAGTRVAKKAESSCPANAVVNGKCAKTKSRFNDRADHLKCVNSGGIWNTNGQSCKVPKKKTKSCNPDKPNWVDLGGGCLPADAYANSSNLPQNDPNQIYGE